jgi:hypothetical protein
MLAPAALNVSPAHEVQDGAFDVELNLPARQSRQIRLLVAVGSAPTLWPGVQVVIGLHTRLEVGEPGIEAYWLPLHVAQAVHAFAFPTSL